VELGKKLRGKGRCTTEEGGIKTGLFERWAKKNIFGKRRKDELIPGPGKKKTTGKTGVAWEVQKQNRSQRERALRSIEERGIKSRGET